MIQEMESAIVDGEKWYTLSITDNEFKWLKDKDPNSYYAHKGSSRFGGINYYAVDVPGELYTIMKIVFPNQLTQ